jgi:hypothetical protein
MQELIKGRLEGLCDSMKELGATLETFKSGTRRSEDLNDLILKEMEKLEFDDFATDRFGNVIGTMNGYKKEHDLVLVFPMDYESDKQGTRTVKRDSYTAGIVTALYSAAVLKRTLLPLTGDLLVCGVPRSACCEFGVKYLFEYRLKDRIKHTDGVILCEPTDMNLFLGHKGRMEYEIVVKVRLSDGFLASRGINMLGTMFPLIHELEELSHNLPASNALGNSSLQIKDVHFCGTRPQEEQNEFKVIVDRTYVPEELQGNILERARMIAESVYRGEDSVSVQTAIAQESILTGTGANVVSEKEIKPWTIQSNHPFVLRALQAITDNGFAPQLGFWKNTITGGSYTFGELGIPTFGFGPGPEPLAGSQPKPAAFDAVKKAVYAQAMMIHRTIGVPTFGWTSDEI